MENRDNSKDIRKENERVLIEKFGVLMEQSGIQPAAARIDALLMISDEIELTFDEIRERLNLSKSSTSTSINMLLRLKRIEYTTKTGDRKRYFKSNVNHWKVNITEKLDDFRYASELLTEIIEHRTDKHPEFNKSIQEFISLMQYITSQLPVLYENWEKQQKNNQK